MFYYTTGTNPRLEVSVLDTYTQADLDRILLFVEALTDSPYMNVVFKVNPAIKDYFIKLIEKNNSFLFYNYRIQ